MREPISFANGGFTANPLPALVSLYHSFMENNLQFASAVGETPGTQGDILSSAIWQEHP